MRFAQKKKSKSPGVSVSCTGLCVIRFILIKSQDSTFRLAQGVLSVSGNGLEKPVSKSVSGGVELHALLMLQLTCAAPS